MKQSSWWHYVLAIIDSFSIVGSKHFCFINLEVVFTEATLKNTYERTNERTYMSNAFIIPSHHTNIEVFSPTQNHRTYLIQRSLSLTYKIFSPTNQFTWEIFSMSNVAYTLFIYCLTLKKLLTPHITDRSFYHHALCLSGIAFQPIFASLPMTLLLVS